MFEKFLEELKKAQVKQDEFKKNPNSAEAKAHVKKAGAAMTVIGVLLLLAGAAEWIYLDMIHFFLPVGGVVLLGFGVHLMITGKMKR